MHVNCQNGWDQLLTAKRCGLLKAYYIFTDLPHAKWKKTQNPSFGGLPSMESPVAYPSQRNHFSLERKSSKRLGDFE